MGKVDIDLDRYVGLGVEGIRAILDDVEEGGLTAEEAEQHLVHIVAVMVDELVPTGPFDAIDDSVIEDGIRQGFEFLKDILHRDPGELRAAADRLDARIARAAAKGRARVGIGLMSVERATQKAAELRIRASALEARAEISGSGE